jgi:cyanophycinase
MGYLLLEGGAEFGGKMSEPDRKAIERAGGPEAPIRIIPTAAAPDDNHQRAGENGVRWFRSLGAKDVASVPLIDRASAAGAAVVEAIRSAKLIYLLGGFPGYLSETLAGSPAWVAALEAYREGAVVGGSSAGAMVLCQFYYDPEIGGVRDGLGLIPSACVLPHHNTSGRGWVSRLAELSPAMTLIGIDERTGIMDDGAGQVWSVFGQGSITLYRGGKTEKVSSVRSFSL